MLEHATVSSSWVRGSQWSGSATTIRLRSFVRAVWEATKTSVIVEEALAVLAVLDAAWSSVEAGREEKLDSRD